VAEATPLILAVCLCAVFVPLQPVSPKQAVLTLPRAFAGLVGGGVTDEPAGGKEPMEWIERDRRDA
jgi:hypothetical protein